MADPGGDSDLRTFIHELMLRYERTMAGFERRMLNFERAVASFEARQVAFERRTDDLIEEMKRHRKEHSAELRDLLDENRAQRQALLRVLDRLDNGGAAAGG